MRSKRHASSARKSTVKSKAAAAAAAAAKKEPGDAPAAASGAAPLSRREALLARVESVRLSQRREGSFDCFGRAAAGYCDQGACAYHAECLSISRLLHDA